MKSGKEAIEIGETILPRLWVVMMETGRPVVVK